MKDYKLLCSGYDLCQPR